MRLKTVEIEGYRSIREAMVFPMDPNVTVVLGANDHGKSNLLSALQHLNPDEGYSAEDLNWDLEGHSARFPRLQFRFELSEEERQKVASLETSAREAANARSIEATLAKEETATEGAATSGSDTERNATDQLAESAQAEASFLRSTEPDRPPQNPDSRAIASPPVHFKDVPASLIAARVGIKGTLSVRFDPPMDTISEHVVALFATTALPRVELIAPVDHIPDAATKANITADSHEFMRGIFLYAGLEPTDYTTIFSQTPRTAKRLRDASVVLNEALGRSWVQGTDLRFELGHHSRRSEVELRIEDPTVKNRFVRPSQRSQGFTHFFSLHTILHARQAEHNAQSYIWLFDEPGIYLHPAGQLDLLVALEALGKSNQLVYVTHSLFMINKNFPTRHRLLLKHGTGTRLHAKPYTGRWQPTLDALGLAMPGTILFASYVLLTEGDADPIIINAVLQALVERARFDGDLNPFSALPTGDARTALAMAAILAQSNPSPEVAFLVDGDAGGKDRSNMTQAMDERFGIKTVSLTAGTTIEDYVILPRLYVEAAVRFANELWRHERNVDDLVADALTRLEAELTDAPKGLLGSVERVIGELGFPDYPSKVGVARWYALMLQGHADDISPRQLQRAGDLAKRITSVLALPMRIRDTERIVSPEDEELAAADANSD